MMLRRFVTSAALLGAVFVGTPAMAQTVIPTTTRPVATFYELTENMRLTAKKVPHRVAISALMGTAEPGTVFCPTALSGNAKCTLNALGEDDINTATGLGTFDAKLTIVVQGDNPIDSPEYVLGKLRVTGKMDFTPAFAGLNYGTVTGRVITPGSEESPAKIVGVFRTPFVKNDPITNAPIACYPDVHILGETSVVGIAGGCIPLRSDEFALTYPTVRFDIWFQ